MSSIGWPQIVTWLIVIAGWGLVNQQNNIREKRKEIRSTIDKIQVILDEIETQAIQYHTKAENNDLAFELKRKLSVIMPNRLDILKLRKINVEKCYPLLKKFRQAITLENFDTANFTPQNLNNDLIKNIWLAKNRLSKELETSFAKKYP